MYHTAMIIQLGFWVSWLLIPIIYELIPAFYSFIVLEIAGHRSENNKDLQRLPRISLIIPVYNAEHSLFNCIRSIATSSYPTHLISIIVANNQSVDRSFSEYRRARTVFSQLLIQWINTSKGKARALNAAIYRTQGKYVIHVDSDGILEHDALLNIVRSFERDPSIAAQTGTILTQKKQIRATTSPFLRFLQENEYCEYAQSFLAGRAYESHEGQLFTMSGAFSAFRREKLLQTKLYNTQTVGEDIDMTFQVRYFLKGKVVLCPEALFYVEPLTGLSKLYTQRQRWQRGELEAIHFFMTKKQLSLFHIISNFIVRRLLMDHTILFLRTIWLAALIFLIPLGYLPVLVGWSCCILYFSYIFICFLNFINIQFYLRLFPKERQYYLSKGYVLFTLPLYYLLCSIIQFIGIINAMSKPGRWKVSTFKEEWGKVGTTIKNDLGRVFKHHD